MTISYLSSTTGSNTVCLEQDYSHPEQCIDNDFSVICPCIGTESWLWAENVYRVETQIETAGQPVLSVSSRQTVRQTPGSDGTNWVVFLQEDGNRNVVIRGHMDLQTLRITPTATPNLKPVLEFNEYVRYSNRPDPVRVRHDLFQLN